MHTYVLRPSLNTFPPGLAREGCSFLADDRRVPEEEWEKNSTELSGSYRAAIMGALYPCGNSTSKLVQELAEAQHEGQTEGREQEKERLKLKKVRTIKLYREGYIEEAEFQGEMAAVELAIRKLDVPEVGGVTYDEVVEAGNTSRAWPSCGMWPPPKSGGKW